MKTLLRLSLSKIILTFALFGLSSYLWRIYITSAISDTFPWGFPLQFYLGWGRCPPGQMCSESNTFFFILDLVFWYIVSGFLVSKLARVRA